MYQKFDIFALTYNFADVTDICSNFWVVLDVSLNF